MGVPERDGEVAEILFEEIVAKNFHNWGKETNLQIQDA